MKRLAFCLLLVVVLGCGGKEAAKPGPPAMDIFQASGEGNLQAVKQHIAAGTDLDQRTSDGSESTPLIVAITFGQAAVAEVLMKARANLELQNKDGNTALFVAAFLCHTEIVQALLENGAKPNVRNNDGATALDVVQLPWDGIRPIYDLVNGIIFQPAGIPLDYERIKATRPKVAQLLSQSGGKNSLPAGNPGAVKQQNAARPAARTWKDVGGNFSIEAVFVRVADDKVVLQRADKTEVSVPLSVLSAADRQYVQERPASSPQADIFQAAVEGNLQAVKQHIASGTDLNQRTPDAEKKTPLMLASIFGRTEVAKALIEAGAGLDALDKDGGTALSAAAFLCHTEIVEALLKKGASKNIKNKQGVTVLQSVEGPFQDVKFLYDFLDGLIFKPAGMPLDYEHLKSTRPKIAQLLR
ncbi:MAG: ankyrin repeat domain-containing protein [Pirellulaceae bacterium]|nr:ankyrin repeat domain-containing protein [Pirellulaceae bacterium]